MFQVQFNAGASRDALRKAIASLEDMTPIYSDVGEYMVAATKQRFQKGVSPDGSAWAPKKESTLERYRRMGYGSRNKPLIGPSGALSRNSVFATPARSHVKIGSSRFYAGVMQFGAAKGAFGSDKRGRPIPWGRIPARAWLGISAEDEREIVQIAEEGIATALGGPS